MKIGELAQKTQCPVQTIRYYEQAGLLDKALRGSNNYRYYNQQHLEQLVFIRNCRNLDMTLDEIGRLLSLRKQPDNCQAVRQLIEEHLDHVEQRLRSLERLQKQLVSLRQQCTSDEYCAIVAELEQTRQENIESSTHSITNSCHPTQSTGKSPSNSVSVKSS